MSIPSTTLDPTVSVSLGGSAASVSIKPKAVAPIPGHSSPNTVIIGVVIGVTCFLLLSVLMAAACCSARLRQKFRFRRRQDGLARCDSAATTLTAGSASLSNASSATVVETHEASETQIIRPQTLVTRMTSSVGGGSSNIVPRGMRTYESYEMDDLRPGYSTGGFLSSI